MPRVSERPEAPTAIQTHLAASFVSLELSRSIWLITSLSPASGEKMSRSLPCEPGTSRRCWRAFRSSSGRRRSGPGKSFPIVVIQEAGLDGFWLRRVLQSEGVGAFRVVDPSSIATSCVDGGAPRQTGIDREALLRALLAYKRGEPRGVRDG